VPAAVAAWFLKRFLRGLHANVAGSRKHLAQDMARDIHDGLLPDMTPVSTNSLRIFQSCPAVVVVGRN